MSEQLSEYTRAKISDMAGKGFTVSAVANSLGLDPERVREAVEAERARRLREAELELDRQKALTFSTRIKALREAIESERAKAAKAKIDAKAGKLPLADIIAGVAAQHGISINDIRSCRRSRRVVYARQEAMYLAYELTEASYPMIAAAVGKDHTSVLHGVRRHAERAGLPIPRSSQAAGGDA
jgi:chromosomal replication initiation ATPase DnaA